MTATGQKILFLGNGRCYHTMDWFRSAQRLCPQQRPVLVTDLVEGESFQRLIVAGDQVEPLLVIDALLLRKQSRLGDIWRNLVKLLLLPIQAWRLRRIVSRYPNAVVHAHSTYYIAMARAAGCRYVATPQGSEVLARPYRSRFYKEFARYALTGARRITVDSIDMQRCLGELFGLDAIIIQNGIDIDAILERGLPGMGRDKIVSMRGIVPNYQIELLLDARNRTLPGTPIHFCYPFSGEEYRAAIARKFIAADTDLGRLSRPDLYRLLQSALLVVSIPLSDSSPRSVYEAIFCGCIVAATDGAWIGQLPRCMRSRVMVVDPRSETWLRDALDAARVRAAEPYVPSQEALEMFDQKRSMQRFYEEIFPLVVGP
jgi:glycosyltransferase involved in cell wall biosynthesis